MANKKKSKPANKSAKPVSKAKGSSKQPVKKVRGGGLTIMLVLIFLHSILATAVAYSTLKAAYLSTSWVLPVIVLISLAGIVAAVAMWYWKQWGIYLYVAISVIGAVIHILLTGSTMVVFYDLIPVAILGYVITLQSKNHLFE
jgi:hypothetical protein